MLRPLHRGYESGTILRCRFRLGALHRVRLEGRDLYSVEMAAEMVLDNSTSAVL